MIRESIARHAGGASAHEQLVVIPGAHDGRIAPFADSVDVLWFPSVDAALGSLQDVDVEDGVRRLLAREITIEANSGYDRERFEIVPR